MNRRIDTHIGYWWALMEVWRYHKYEAKTRVYRMGMSLSPRLRGWLQVLRQTSLLVVSQKYSLSPLFLYSVLYFRLIGGIVYRRVLAYIPITIYRYFIGFFARPAIRYWWFRGWSAKRVLLLALSVRVFIPMIFSSGLRFVFSFTYARSCHLVRYVCSRPGPALVLEILRASLFLIRRFLDPGAYLLYFTSTYR